MSNYTDFVLFVDALDDDENVATFNEWLKVEWPSTQPQFEATGVLGVFTVSINNAAKGTLVVEMFRGVNWVNHGNYAKLMIRLEGQECWETHSVKEIPDS